MLLRRNQLMTAMERLLTFYNAMSSDSMQKVALKNILVHFNEIGELSIFELADLCYTSSASISRLVRKLGYKNYSYFQKDILDNTSQYERHNRFISPESVPKGMETSAFFLSTLENLYQAFLENIDYDKIHEVNRMMRESRKTALYTYSVFMTELFIQSDLFMSGIVCDIQHNEEKIFEDIKSLKKEDFVILVAPDSSEGLPIKKLVREIHEKGSKICLITGSRRRAESEGVEVCFLMPGVKTAVDMFNMQLLLCIIDIEYRKAYID